MDEGKWFIFSTIYVPVFLYPVYDSFPWKVIQSSDDLSRTCASVLFTVERSRYQAIEEVPAGKVLEHHQDFAFRVKHLLETNYTHVVELFQDLQIIGWWRKLFENRTAVKVKIRAGKEMIASIFNEVILPTLKRL